LHIGPILFREEAIFKREIKFEDKIVADIEVTHATEDFARWSLRHSIYKDDDILCAVLNLDGAWIDIVKRKLAVPNEYVQNIFRNFPRSADFEWIVRK
jgi:acyl-CoA thioester hydrolase